MRAIFQDNASLCNDVTERVIQHFVHCIESHGRHVHYMKFLQTIVKAEGTYIRRCQDLVMAEVGLDWSGSCCGVFSCVWYPMRWVLNAMMYSEGRFV